MSTRKHYGRSKFNSSEIRSTFYVGNEAQINAGLGVLCQVMSDQKRGLSALDYKILLFGQSGSGKSSYPEALARNFTENDYIADLIRREKRKRYKVSDGFTLFRIKCNDLMSALRDENSARHVLSGLEAEIASNKPAVVAFDELDAFAPERMKMIPSSPYVFYWTMSFMQKNKRGLVVFGILNQPGILEAAVMSQIDNLLYFRELDQKIVRAILERRCIPNAAELALKLCTSTSLVVLGNELRNACDKTIQTLGEGDPKKLKGVSMRKIAQTMMLWLRTTWEQREEYEEVNVDHIRKAEEAMDFWGKRYKHFLKEGL